MINKQTMELELYIHIPFCIKKCDYCDFLSAPADEKTREVYVETLCQEILTCPETVRTCLVSTIFFGGGTPSLLTGSQMQAIMNAVRERFRVAEDAEITMEMNPGTVDKEKLEIFRSCGINRISMGLQSVHDDELRMLGRIHTFAEFLDAWKLTGEVGFTKRSIDLISAIPGQTVESWEETLKTVIALEPDHLSAYSLIIEPGTPFYERYGEDPERAKAQEGWPSLPDEDAEREMYYRTKEILHQAGYDRYEISNYAKEGAACRHNLGYWERVPYLGFGVGAASLVPEELLVTKSDDPFRGRTARYQNPPDMETYRECMGGKFRAKLLTLSEEMEEFMFLGLRKMEGVSIRQFEETFSYSMEEVYGKKIEKLEKVGLLGRSKERLWLTERGIDISNAVFVEFLLEDGTKQYKIRSREQGEDLWASCQKERKKF